ncbi:hypothetical protein AAMO2058_001749400, partial [Amorphochlora amoebiformis]
MGKKRAYQAYQSRQLKEEMKQKPKFSTPKRFSPIREAYENQKLRPGELPGIAPLGGLGEYSMAEAQIQKAVAQGQMDKLKGSQMPLNREENLSLWTDHAGMKVINRILAAQGFRPRSLELRESVEMK